MRGLAQRLVLFVCSGNTSRSPMAQALCNDEILRRLGLSLERLDNLPLRAVSAGLTVLPGRPLSTAAQSTLQQLGMARYQHSSREITPELVEQAERIFCMTDGQCRSLVSRFPESATKVKRLDPEGDIEDPSSQDLPVFLSLAVRIQSSVRHRVSEMVPA